MSFADRESRRSSVVGSMISQKPAKTADTDKKKLKQKCTYLTPELTTRLKVEAAQTGKKDYQIIMEGLELYFEKYGE